MAYSNQLADHFEQRLPTAKYETVDVKFMAANTDVIVAHTLLPKLPVDVKFIVIDNPTGGVVFRGTRAPQTTYTVLQSTVAGTYRVRLFIEPWLNQ